MLCTSSAWARAVDDSAVAPTAIAGCAHRGLVDAVDPPLDARDSRKRDDTGAVVERRLVGSSRFTSTSVTPVLDQIVMISVADGRRASSPSVPYRIVLETASAAWRIDLGRVDHEQRSSACRPSTSHRRRRDIPGERDRLRRIVDRRVGLLRRSREGSRRSGAACSRGRCPRCRSRS
jgi:hypothetical protein